jgi:hypothetical protein
MKRNLLLLAAFLALPLFAQQQVEVVTGAGYANDAFYSLETGTVDTVPRNNWDIAFSTGLYSASIMANTASVSMFEPTGVELYTYTLGDIDDWDNVDTTGMVWNRMYNSLETSDLEGGAFNAHATDHPDYGWGVYTGMGLLFGDSIYIIKTIGGNYKKLAIVQKSYPMDFSESIYDFKFANLDGSEEQSVTLHTGEYSSKAFVYYSIDSLKVIDREPPKLDWDLLFTKYTEYVDYQPFYDVTGILTNEDHIVAQEIRESGMDQSTFTDVDESQFPLLNRIANIAEIDPEPNITLIGYDWKKFDFSTGYVLTDTVVYFLKKYLNWDTESDAYQDSVYYKIYFTGFSGMSEGKYTFVQEELLSVDVKEELAPSSFHIYPNPASDQLNLVYDHVGLMEVTIFDATGRSVLTSSHRGTGFNQLTLNISSLEHGIFFLQIEAGDASDVLRFIKE